MSSAYSLLVMSEILLFQLGLEESRLSGQTRAVVQIRTTRTTNHS
jgi:hypothetical protein